MKRESIKSLKKNAAAAEAIAQRAMAELERRERASAQRSNRKLIGRCFRRISHDQSGNAPRIWEFARITQVKRGETTGHTFTDHGANGVAIVRIDGKINLKDLSFAGRPWSPITYGGFKAEYQKMARRVLS